MFGGNKPNTSVITQSGNPTTKTGSPQTLTQAISGIAPGWAPGGYRFITPQQQQAMNTAYDNSVKTMTAARNRLEFNRQMMGDYGLGKYFFNIPIRGSLFTNKTYLDSRLPYEKWAGSDGEFAPVEKYPLDWGKYETI